MTGRYEDNWLGIVQRSHPLADERLIKARAKTLVVAAGSDRASVRVRRQRPAGGDDLGGGSAADQHVRREARRTGGRVHGEPIGDAAADDLRRAGVEVVAEVDARRGESLVSADGPRDGVSSVELGDGTTIEADLLVTAVGWTAPTSLLNMAGDRPVYDPSAARFFPHDPPDNVLVTGGLAGDGIARAAGRPRSRHRRPRGRGGRSSPGTGSRTQRPAPSRWAAPPPITPTTTAPPSAATPTSELFRASTHGIVDYSEDVSSKDLFGAAAEGYDSVELIKRFTTATMGPSQGKLETVNTVAVLAEARGETIAEVGTTVWRPPYAPITLGALGGRVFEPVRVSSIQPWHEANGSTPILAGQWIRPEHYGDPEAEVRNTRTNVGITDVTPLGKLDLQGPDVAEAAEPALHEQMDAAPGGRRCGTGSCVPRTAWCSTTA